MIYDILETNMTTFIVSSSDEDDDYLSEHRYNIPAEDMGTFLLARSTYEEARRRVELWMRISKARDTIAKSQEELGGV